MTKAKKGLKAYGFIPFLITIAAIPLFTLAVSVLKSGFIGNLYRLLLVNSRAITDGVLFAGLPLLLVAAVVARRLLGKKAEVLRAVALFFIAGAAVRTAFTLMAPPPALCVILWAYCIVLPSWISIRLEEAMEALKPAGLFGAWLVAELKGLFTATVKDGKKTVSRLSKTVTINASLRKKVFIAAAVLLSMAAVYAAGKTAYDALFIDVKISPDGETRQDSEISAKFSQPVAAVKNGSIECFKFTPELTGTYKMSGDDTVVFRPSSPLAPATKYTVEMDTSLFKADGKTINAPKKGEFNTPSLKVTEGRSFMNKNALQKDEELVVELNFNYQVDIKTLESMISVKKILKNETSDESGDESNISFKVEKTSQPTRFYVKVSDIEKTDRFKQIAVRVNDGLTCQGCGEPMKRSYTRTINIGKKEELRVLEVMPWPVEGKTAIAIQFNMPVSMDTVDKAVFLSEHYGSPGDIKFKATAEYSYLILEAKLEKNNSYTVTVNRELKSVTGEKLDNYYSENYYYRGIPSKAEFAEDGEILSPSGNLIIPVNVINAQSVNVSISKVFKNNLVYYLQNRYGNESVAKPVFSTVHKVQDYVQNKQTTEYISLERFQKEPYKGVFAINLHAGEGYYYDDYDYNRSNKTVICTDIGMIAKEEGGDLHVKVFSVSNLRPMVGIGMKLISHNNQVMKARVSGLDGKVVFEDYKKSDYGFMPFIIMAESGDDFSYLKLSDSVLNTQRFDTAGVPNGNTGMTAFVTSDRGLYRPGEKARITVIARNRNMTVPPAITVRMKISGPQGESVYDEKQKLQNGGITVFEPVFSTGAMTGQYRAQLFVNDREQAGSAEFKVEEFIPDKLRVAVTTEKEYFEYGDPVQFTVKAEQMFGAPAAGNRVEARLSFTGYEFTSKKYPDHIFSDPDRRYERREERLGEEALNSEGKYRYVFDMPSDINPPSALQAQAYVDVFDDGGRPVSGFKQFVVYPYDSYIGIKTSDGKRAYREGEAITFDIAAVTPGDRPRTVNGVQFVIKKRVWLNTMSSNWWWRSSHESVDYRQDVYSGAVDIKNGTGTYIFKPKEKGEYFVYAGDEYGMRTGIVVNVTGAGTSTYDMEKSDRVQIEFDKKNYAAGDTAVVTVSAPFDGMLLLSVEREKVFQEYRLDIKEGSATARIKVSPELFPNAYVVAVAVRKQDEKYLGMPVLAYGIRNIAMDTAAKDLKPEINCGDKVFSNDGIKVTVKTKGGPGTAVLLFAVDEGILQIVRFATPDPLGFFYSKRALDVITYTTLNKILTDVKALKQPIGGDYSEPTRKHLNPVLAKIVEPFAKYSGVLYTDLKGEAKYTFDAKNFNGKVRVMALAAKNDSFGSAEKQVNVADAIVVTPNLPRFLAPGDVFRSVTKIFNNTGRASDFTFKLTASGPVTIDKPEAVFKLKPEEETKVVFEGKAAEDTGKVELKYSVTGGGAVVAMDRELGVRPAQHTETRVQKGALEPGSSTEQDVDMGYSKLMKVVRLNVAYSRFAEVCGGLEYLIQYPYGCVEQTTSSTFPMVFFRDMGLDNSSIAHAVANVDAYVASGMKRLQTFITPEGRLSYWPGGDWPAPQYLHLYVAELLIEAKSRGFYVPEDLYGKVMAATGLNSTGSIDMMSPEDTDEEYYYGHREDPRFYELYLRSLMGAPDTKALNYMEKLLVTYQGSLKSPTGKLEAAGYDARALQEVKKREGDVAASEAGDFVEGLTETETYLLSLAFSKADMRKAAKLLLDDRFSTKLTGREMWYWFNSYNKMLGMYLYAVSEADQGLSKRVLETENMLIGRLEKNGSFGNTQETCWALRGLAASNKAAGKTGLVKADIAVNGRQFESVANAKSKAWADTKNDWKKVKVTNSGTAKLYYNINVEGIPKKKRESDSVNGISIYKQFYDEDGQKLDLSNVKQGQLAVVTVTLQPLKQGLTNLIIVDLLPAGFEIENPRLNSRGNLNFTAKSDMDAAYQDIRDDRILLFTKGVEGEKSFSYTVRAVTPGRFTIPNVFAEAMYDPEIYGEDYISQDLVVKPAQ